MDPYGLEINRNLSQFNQIKSCGHILCVNASCRRTKEKFNIVIQSLCQRNDPGFINKEIMNTPHMSLSITVSPSSTTHRPPFIPSEVSTNSSKTSTKMSKKGTSMPKGMKLSMTILIIIALVLVFNFPVVCLGLLMYASKFSLWKTKNLLRSFGFLSNFYSMYRTNILTPRCGNFYPLLAGDDLSLSLVHAQLSEPPHLPADRPWLY